MIVRPCFKTQFVHISKISLVTACLSLILVTQLSAQNTKHYYRYFNTGGVKVISSTIPTEYVKSGYDIVTIDGRLIERVAPELSEDEKQKLRLRIEEEKRIELWDKELLKQYSRPADIEAAKQRKLKQNETSIGIIKHRIEKIDQEIIYYQGLAAADERAGKEVSIDTLHAIQKLNQDREIELQEVELKRQEAKSIVKTYDKDIARFKIIRPNIR